MNKIYKPLLVDIIKGRDLGGKIDVLLSNQSMTKEEISRYQNQKIDELIKHTIETVPYYRNKYGPYKEGIKLKDFEPLAKDIVQKEPAAFISNLYPKDKLRYAKTSGSTGKPLVFYYDDNERAWNRAVTARSLSWWGACYGERILRVWGMPDSLVAKIKMHGIYLINNILTKNVFKLSKDDTLSFLSIVKLWKPSYIYGYTNGIYEMAGAILKYLPEFSVPSIKLAITTSEMLRFHQRQAIAKAFKCNVAQEYGVGEVGIIGFECKKGNIHVNDDMVYIEKSDNDSALVTSLVNYAMPLIRYNTGDMVELSNEKCSCGLPFSSIKTLKGRNSEIIKYEDKTIHSEVFDYIAREFITEDNKEITNFQVVRTKENHLQFVVVPGERFDEEKLIKTITQFVKAQFGDTMVVTVEAVDKLSRTPVGKIRFYSDERQDKSQ